MQEAAEVADDVGVLHTLQHLHLNVSESSTHFLENLSLLPTCEMPEFNALESQDLSAGANSCLEYYSCGPSSYFLKNF